MITTRKMMATRRRDDNDVLLYRINKNDINNYSIRDYENINKDDDINNNKKDIDNNNNFTATTFDA